MQCKGGIIYNIAAAARMAPNAAMMDPERVAPLLGLTVWTPVGVEVGDGVPDATIVPFVPVGAAPDPLDGDPPMPAPWEGERPPPDEASSVAEARVERDEAALEREGAPDDSDPDEPVVVGEASLVTDVDPDPDPEDGVELAWDADEEATEDADEDEATALQERSYSGVVLRVLPTSPKLGAGTVGSESWRVNHHVFTLPRSGHATSSQ